MNYSSMDIGGGSEPGYSMRLASPAYEDGDKPASEFNNINRQQQKYDITNGMGRECKSKQL